MDNEVNMHDLPGASAGETGGQGATGAEHADASAESTITTELRLLGQKLASAARAATSTEEAESLKADIREGMRQLRHELDQVMETTKATTQRATSESSDVMQRARAELANALRVLNRAFEQMAAVVEPGDAKVASNGGAASDGAAHDGAQSNAETPNSGIM